MKTEQKTFKPGKWYGIIALLCVLAPIPVGLLNVMFGAHVVGGSLWYALPGLINILLLAVALIFGVRGRKTEGHLYANVALIIVLLLGLFALVGGIVFFVHTAILELPT
jgi:hypothetical protein